MDSVWQRSINRRQKVLRMKRVWWNCCVEMDAAPKQFVEDRLPRRCGSGSSESRILPNESHVAGALLVSEN